MVRGATKDKVVRRDAFLLPSSLPTKTRCIQLEIPDSFEYEVLVYSALQILCKWNSYQQDGGHFAADVAYLFRETLRLTECDDSETFDGVFVEDCMACGFRVNPDNNCQLQIWCNGSWELFWDISSCVKEGIAQQSNGGTLAAGECQEWDVALKAYDKWLLPIGVDAGDIITITVGDGITNDGTELIWRWPDGQVYVFGLHDHGQINSGSDPAPTVYHSSLIASVDAVFFDAYNTTIAVPSGVSNAQVFFQMNNDDLHGSSGAVAFHVKVCKQSEVETPITITYGFGSGSASVLDGGIISVSSGCCGGGGGADTGMKIQFSENVRVEIIGQTGFVLGCPDDCGWMHSSNAADTPIRTILRSEFMNPIEWPSTEVFRNLYVESVTAAADFHLTIIVHRA